MTPEQRIAKLEREVESLRNDLDVNYEDIALILKHLRKWRPEAFAQGGRLKPIS